MTTEVKPPADWELYPAFRRLAQLDLLGLTGRGKTWAAVYCPTGLPAAAEEQWNRDRLVLLAYLRAGMGKPPDSPLVDELKQFAPDFKDIDPEEFVQESRAD